MVMDTSIEMTIGRMDQHYSTTAKVIETEKQNSWSLHFQLALGEASHGECSSIGVADDGTV